MSDENEAERGIEALLRLAARDLPPGWSLAIRAATGEVSVVAYRGRDMAEWPSTWRCEGVAAQLEDILGHLGIGPKAGAYEDEADDDEERDDR